MKDLWEDPKYLYRVVVGVTKWNKDMKKELTNVISKFQMSTDKKGMIFGKFIKNDAPLKKVDKDFKGPIEEILNLKY